MLARSHTAVVWQEDRYFSVSKEYSHVEGGAVSQGNMKLDKLRSAETSVHLYNNTQHHLPETLSVITLSQISQQIH
jgi:hypothetical protein